MKATTRTAPHVVKVGNVKIPIYRTPTGSRERHTVAWREAGVRKRKVFDRFEDAKREAGEIALKLSRGHVAALNLTAADHESYVTALRELPPGTMLHEVARQWKAATALLPEGVSILDAVRAYPKRVNGDCGKALVSELAAKYLAQSEEAQAKKALSIHYVRTLRTHLKKFTATFKVPIGNVEPPEIDAWLRSSTSSPKYWNNLKATLVTFFGYAREQGHLPADVPTAAEKVKRKKLKSTDIGILAPGNLSKLLRGADDEARLYLAVGAFTGIRVAEMLRLTWERFDFEMGLVRLDKTITKTGQKRNVPILPALAAWLEPYKNRKGKLFAAERSRVRTIEFAKEQGVDWPLNCLRHSFASYRVAAVKNQPQVALEMGNSVSMIQRHYDSVVTEQEALAWFSIMPEKPANVLSMEAA